MTWVCGPQVVLRQDVIKGFQDKLPGASFSCRWADDKGVWDDLLTVPTEPRLVAVYRADKADSSLVPALLEDEFDGSYVVFLSDEDDFRRKDKQLVPYLCALRDSRHGQLIRCCLPASEEEKTAMVASWWPGAGRNLAGDLLQICGGDATAAYHAIRKAHLAGIKPTATTLSIIVHSDRKQDFAEMVFKGDKAGACTAACLIPQDEGLGVIGLLSSRLNLVPLVREALNRREDAAETVRRLRVDAFVIRQVRPYAHQYPKERVARCHALLAMAETSWKHGAREGVLEALASLW